MNLIYSQQDNVGLKRHRSLLVGCILLVCLIIGFVGFIEFIPSKSSSNSFGMNFVLVNAGEFFMGSDELGKSHKVIISQDYYLQDKPVTQGQWKKVMGTTPWSKYLTTEANDDLPAVCISRDEAINFINKLNLLTKEMYRLPTEAEWEYACRAGTTTNYAFGNDERLLQEYAWLPQDYGSGETFGIHPVGKKKPNAWGFYDMHGNIYEWCHDVAEPQTSETQVDPRGPAHGGMYYDRLYIVKGMRSAGSPIGRWSGSRRARRSDFSDVQNNGIDTGFRVAKRIDKRFLYDPQKKTPDIPTAHKVAIAKQTKARLLINKLQLFMSNKDCNLMTLFTPPGSPDEKEIFDDIMGVDISSPRLFYTRSYSPTPPNTWDDLNFKEDGNRLIVTVLEQVGKRGFHNPQTGEWSGAYKYETIFEFKDYEGSLRLDKYYHSYQIGLKKHHLKYGAITNVFSPDGD